MTSISKFTVPHHFPMKLLDLYYTPLETTFLNQKTNKMKKTNGTGLVPTFKSWMEDFWGADNVFADDFFRMKKNWMPAVNIKDEKKSFEIELAAPGLKKDDFIVKVENGMLRISAEREETKEETEADYARKEFSYRSFERTFALPENVNPEHISAKYTDGILKLVLKKMATKEETPKKIKVS